MKIKNLLATNLYRQEGMNYDTYINSDDHFLVKGDALPIPRLEPSFPM